MVFHAVRSTWTRILSAQLGNPSGVLGGMVAKQLNRNNRLAIVAAVEAIGSLPAMTVADIGFGGGLGLELLLSTATDGHVHGVEPSPSMIARARRAFPDEIANGRLVLHDATMDSLPFDDGLLDRWISLNTVYFIPDLSPSLSELARVLATDGVGVLGVADPDFLATASFAQHGFTVRPIHDLVAQIEGAGMSVERRTAARQQSEAPFNLLLCRRR